MPIESICKFNDRANLTGRLFGKLVCVKRALTHVVDKRYSTKDNTRYKLGYECLCECGNKRVVVTNKLTSGKVTHCGCLNPARYDASKISTSGFSISGRARINGKAVSRFNCVCECGREFTSLSSDVYNGIISGCAKCMKSRGSSRSDGVASANPIKFKLSRIKDIKKSVELTGRDWSISDEDAIRLINGECAYCGYSCQIKGIGIDRIDSDHGYIYGNVNPCCKRCNLMKKDLSLDYFLNHCVKIMNHCVGASTNATI